MLSPPGDDVSGRNVHMCPGGMAGDMRLIHLSDIHFGGYGDGWDENKDQRNELLLDVASLVREGGAADGVLVGGDIAYHARKDQYDEATAWLRQVCKAGECLEGRVWVVPGNHDVDRGMHDRMMARQMLLQTVRSAEPSKLTGVLNEWFLVDPAAEGLDEPRGDQEIEKPRKTFKTRRPNSHAR